MRQNLVHTDSRVYYRYDDRILVDLDLFKEILTIPADRRGKVTFVYRNTKTGKESVHPDFTWERAMNLAERRVRNRKYKNFEFIIY